MKSYSLLVRHAGLDLRHVKHVCSKQMNIADEIQEVFWCLIPFKLLTQTSSNKIVFRRRLKAIWTFAWLLAIKKVLMEFAVRETHLGQK